MILACIWATVKDEAVEALDAQVLVFLFFAWPSRLLGVGFTVYLIETLEISSGQSSGHMTTRLTPLPLKADRAAR